MHDFVAHLNRIEEQLKSTSKAINIPTSSLMTFKEAAHNMKISSGHLMEVEVKWEYRIRSAKPEESYGSLQNNVTNI